MRWGWSGLPCKDFPGGGLRRGLSVEVFGEKAMGMIGESRFDSGARKTVGKRSSDPRITG